MSEEQQILVETSYGEYFEDVKDKICDRGFLNKEDFCELFMLDLEDDSWIMDLEGWDYEVPYGKEVFRPTLLRGKL